MSRRRIVFHDARLETPRPAPESVETGRNLRLVADWFLPLLLSRGGFGGCGRVLILSRAAGLRFLLRLLLLIGFR